MIPNNTETVDVQSNIDADVTGQFTVDENSLAKIMSVLTNLYSDPELAVVREYLTNALDAQIEAQELDPNYVWRPIEVITPSHFNKEYKVRDFGTGMSVDDIKEIYSKYGKSTKEHSNAVTGMLGLGSKCALTYTGQFTITGYKNGVRTRAVVSKDDNDIPVFMIVDTRATKEPNGVEISVPVRDRNSFETKTAEFLKWWKPGQVLVNGNEPKHHNLKEVKPGIFLIERENDRYSYRYEPPQSYVIMGNVPYQVDAEYVEDALRSAYLGFAAYVDMGAVDFPPSREKLFYNNRTKKALTEISNGLFNAILKEKLDEITNAPDHRTAWTRYQELDSHFRNAKAAKDLKYKGLDFSDRLGHNHMVLDWDWQGHGQIAERQWVNMSGAMGGTLVVTGVAQDSKPTSYFKKKVRHYIETNGIDAHNALLVEDDIDSRWLDWLPRIDADTIKAIKLPKNGPVGPKVEAPYEFWTVDGNGQAHFDSSLIVKCPAGKTLVHISPQDMKETYRKSGTHPETFAKKLGKDYILVVLGKNRFQKYLRSHPNSITAFKAVEDKVKALAAAATPAEFIVGKLGYGERSFFEKVDHSMLDDPEMVTLAKTVQGKGLTMNYEAATNLASYANRASIYVSVPGAPKTAGANPAKKYPLLEHVGARQMRHLCLYVNAVYADSQAKP